MLVTLKPDQCSSILFCLDAVKGTKKPRQRATKLSALEMFEQKFEKKSELKKMELELKKKELELKQIQMDRDHEEKIKLEDERKKRMDMEFNERKAFMELIQNLSSKQN